MRSVAVWIVGAISLIFSAGTVWSVVARGGAGATCGMAIMTVVCLVALRGLVD